MILEDKNKVFFTLIHYILSEQKNVNWILKTSLIDFTGISSLLEEKPYATDSILQDVVNYATMIKPYHVQFSHYFEHYQTASETIYIPRNDWINQTISMRFDALQSYPDINKIFYTILTNLPEAGYNNDGIVIYNMADDHFYERQNIDNTLVWTQLDDTLKDGYYYTEKTNTFYKTEKVESFVIRSTGKIDLVKVRNSLYFVKNTMQFYKIEDNEYRILIQLDEGADNTVLLNKIKSTLTIDYIVDESSSKNLVEFTPDMKKEFCDTHEANRLFYMGLHDREEIKKELNGNFKGIEVNGSVFDIEKFGYDIFNYDTEDYDSPTIMYDYYFVDGSEDNFTHPTTAYLLDSSFNIDDPNLFQKTFTKVGEHRFTLNNLLPLNSGESYQVYKVLNNGLIKRWDDKEFVPPYTYIDIFNGLKNGEKLYITTERDPSEEAEDPRGYVKAAIVIECCAFSESTSEVLHREFVKYNPNGTMSLIPPAVEIGGNDKIAIQKKNSIGAVIPFLNYTVEDGKIVISSTSIHIGEHIIMTSFDYKYLYDKIYTWEDRYGRSNNIVNLFGDKFLRARYEEDRTSERVVSYPLTSLIIDQHDNSNYHKIFRNDYKNDMKTTTMLNTVGTDIIKVDLDKNHMLVSLYVNNIKNIDIPMGQIIVNGEIIEYKNVIEHVDESTDTKTWELTNLNRGIDGTTLFSSLIPKYAPFKNTHEVGDTLIPYHDDEWTNIERNNICKSYNILDTEIMSYNVPTGMHVDSDIELHRISKINLLENVYEASKEIIIDSCNVVSGWLSKDSKGNPIPLQTVLTNETTDKVYNGDFHLKINDDNIPFTGIAKDRNRNNAYKLSGITLPEKYKGYGDTVIYSSLNSFIYGCLPNEYRGIDFSNSPSFKVKNLEDYTISIVEGDYTYDIIEENGSSLVRMPSGDDVFRIDGSNVYEIGTKLNSEIDGYPENTDPEFVHSEKLFGTIINNTVYKLNGDIYAKIEDDKFIEVQVLLNLEQVYKKGESIHINVIN